MTQPVTSSVRMPTAHASRYLQQLCKHWSHNLAVTFSESEGTVTFPRKARGADWPGDATLALQAQADGLDCRLEASSTGQLEALQGAVARHLDRFAFREAAAAQLVYLVGFSLAHFWDGFTGLTVTILAILTLFLLMQLTGRIRWSETLTAPSVRTQP